MYLLICSIIVHFNVGGFRRGDFVIGWGLTKRLGSVDQFECEENWRVQMVFWRKIWFVSSFFRRRGTEGKVTYGTLWYFLSYWTKRGNLLKASERARVYVKWVKFSQMQKGFPQIGNFTSSWHFLLSRSAFGLTDICMPNSSKLFFYSSRSQGSIISRK